MIHKKMLSPEETAALLSTLKMRFEKHPERHQGIDWPTVQSRLESNPGKLWSLDQMERSEGEPDVIGKTGKDAILFCDCSPESPKGRRSVCYDREALDKRKEHKPVTSAVDFANEMGVEILTEAQYRELQKLGKFDLKSSSWVKTPANIRKLGGALFCDRRYELVFTYHNGADSYYAARGFRGLLEL